MVALLCAGCEFVSEGGSDIPPPVAEQKVSFSDQQDGENAGIDSGSEVTSVQAGAETFLVELAQTPDQWQQGLMGREVLGENKGMLFVFPDAAVHGFWMKNTLIPLDIVWLDAEGVVLHVATLTPCTADPCPITQPDVPAHYVLEVNAGVFPLEVGERVMIPDDVLPRAH